MSSKTKLGDLGCWEKTSVPWCRSGEDDLFANRLKAKGLEPVTRSLLEKDEGFEDIRRSGLVGESEEEVLLYLLENLSVILTQINPKAGLALSKLCYSTRRG